MPDLELLQQRREAKHAKNNDLGDPIHRHGEARRRHEQLQGDKRRF